MYGTRVLTDDLYCYWKLSVPVVLYAAMKKDRYRKPMTGMWDDMAKEHNNAVAIGKWHADQQEWFSSLLVTKSLRSKLLRGGCSWSARWMETSDKEGSFMCRQVREKNSIGWPHKKISVGLTALFCIESLPRMSTFHSTHLKHSSPRNRKLHLAGVILIPTLIPWNLVSMTSFSLPWTYLRSSPFIVPLFTPTSTPLTPGNTDAREMILFVGRPASGKSTFAMKHLIPNGYAYVNQVSKKTIKQPLSSTVYCYCRTHWRQKPNAWKLAKMLSEKSDL